MRALFIAWDGPHQSYLESLFFPIFERLGQRGVEVHSCQLRFGGLEHVEAARTDAARRGLSYVHLPILPRPKIAGAAFSLARGVSALVAYVRRHRIDVLMPRSTLPGTMTLALRRVFPRRRIVFDADGLAPDERVDFAGWRPTGPMYRVWRESDAQLVRVASSVITRTQRAKDILVARAGAGTREDKVHVIPNGKDENIFTPGDRDAARELRERLGVGSTAPLVVYVGTLGPHYFPCEMMRFFWHVRSRRPDAHFVVLTGHADVARRASSFAAIPPEAITIGRVPAAEVPSYLAAADLGLALRAPVFSQRAVSPIKVGEYLLCGLPVLATAGVGDLDEQLAEVHGVARLLTSCDDEAIRRAADWFIDDVLPKRAQFRERARRRGLEVFGLERCVERYARALAWAEESGTAHRLGRVIPGPETETKECPAIRTRKPW